MSVQAFDLEKFAESALALVDINAELARRASRLQSKVANFEKSAARMNTKDVHEATEAICKIALDNGLIQSNEKSALVDRLGSHTGALNVAFEACKMVVESRQNEKKAQEKAAQKWELGAPAPARTSAPAQTSHYTGMRSKKARDSDIAIAEILAPEVAERIKAARAARGQ